MKRLISIVSCFCLTGLMHAQYLDKCMPTSLIVTGNDVNFRTEPNTNSISLGKFANGELINFISIFQEGDYQNYIGLPEAWVKVERVSTGEQGFIFGKYVKTQEMAYENYADCDRIQNGNWYGIFQDSNKVILQKTTPTLKELDIGYLSIAGSGGNPKLLICSQSELDEGIIDGQFYGTDGKDFSIGMYVSLLRIKDNNFSLACTGEVELNAWMGFSRKNEKVHFIIEEIDGSQRHYHKQDLTDCLHQFGEGGYTLIFAGDLNNDGIPEIILSEVTTQTGLLYYFMSDKDRKLELKSIAVSSSKC